MNLEERIFYNPVFAESEHFAEFNRQLKNKTAKSKISKIHAAHLIKPNLKKEYEKLISFGLSIMTFYEPGGIIFMTQINYTNLDEISSLMKEFDAKNVRELVGKQVKIHYLPAIISGKDQTLIMGYSKA